MRSTEGASGGADGAAEADRPGPRPRRATLAVRASAAMGVVALVAVLLAGSIALPLVGQAAEDQARRQLAASADLVAATVDRQNAANRPGGLARLRTLLAQQQIELLLLRPRVAAVLESGDVAVVAGGGSVSGTRTVLGRRSLLEARPTGVGTGVALVQPLAEISSPRREAVRRLALALTVGLAGGALAGLARSGRVARPVRRAAGAAQELAAGQRDVRVEPEGPAEVAEVAEAINELAAALARSEGRQREFLLSVSHELRTPLTAVRGYAEALADGVVTPERTPQTGATILAEAQRLTRLVEDLMELARLRADSFPLQVDAVDLGRLVAEAAQVWGDRCTAAGTRLDLAAPAGPVHVRADPERVRQVLDGLAENALRMLGAGGVLVFALSTDAAVGVLEIRDSGPGLTDDDIEIAFERSALHDRYRGERRVGAGVGLALIDELVRRMGGTVTAGHAAEGGAAFTVRLPRCSDVAAART